MDYFGELYYRAFGSKLESRAEAEARKVVELLNPRSLLDVGCGWGRHLRYFLSWGIDAYGVEPEPYFVSTFKAAYPQWAERIILGRIQEVKPFRTFDTVVSLWTSIGWDDEEDAIFARISEFVDKDGYVLVETDNLDGWRTHFCRRWWEKVDNGFVLDQHKLKGSRLHSRREFILGGEHRVIERQLKLFSLEDIIRLATPHGLELRKAFSSLDGQPFYQNAPRLCAVFQKVT
ncbi:methyltransferase domain-containing protein [Coprothermobacteraceae bacterium]|nr:methyltransferase domain-containing protein [Coprothermobacteraceae bacterium]